MRQISAAVFGGWVLGTAVLACSGTDGTDLFPSAAEGTTPNAGERAPSDEVTNGGDGGGGDGGGGDGAAFRFDGNDGSDGNNGGAGGADPDGSGPTPTWTDLYSRYFGPNTPGHCGRCHRNGCELNKSACYQWFARKKQFPLQTSRLTWFGGDMPNDNLAPNPQAELDMTAWQTSGGENN